MFFKYYPIVIFTLGILLGVYVYTITSDIFILELPFDKSLEMPIAIWITSIIYIVFFISLLFLFIERLLIFLEKNAFNNDKNTLIKKIKNSVIQRDDNSLVLKTKSFKELGSVIDSFDFTPKANVIDCENIDIKKLLAMYNNLQNGEEVDVYKFNIPQTSALFTLNVRNMINKSYKNGFSILKNKTYIYDLKKFAFIALLKGGDRKEIEKYKDCISFDKEITCVYLDIFLDGKIDIQEGEISLFCKNAKFTKEDYLTFAKKSKGKLEPTYWIRLFETLADNDELAEEAYFYVLLELEMLDSIKDRLKSQPINEFVNVRAYLDLKNAKKSYPTDIFFK